MPHARGFQDGFIDLVQEQLNLSRQELADIDERIADLHEERAAAAKRVEQLEGLVEDRVAGRASEAVVATAAGPTEPEARKPFADADAVVNLIAERGQAMHYLDIFAELVQRGFEVGGKRQPDTLLSRFFNDPRLRRTARGTYDLAERRAPGRNGHSPVTGSTPQLSQPEPATDLWYLTGSGGLQATGCFEGGRIRVLRGSQARKRTGNLSNSSQKAARIRGEMIRTGELEDQGDHYELRDDRVLDTPSLAAIVMSGVSLNGWRTWKNSAGQTLDQVHRHGSRKAPASKHIPDERAGKKPRPPMRYGR